VQRVSSRCCRHFLPAAAKRCSMDTKTPGSLSRLPLKLAACVALRRDGHHWVRQPGQHDFGCVVLLRLEQQACLLHLYTTPCPNTISTLPLPRRPLPPHTSAHQVLSWMEQCAYISASRLRGAHHLTASMDGVSFAASTRVGDILYIISEVSEGVNDRERCKTWPRCPAAPGARADAFGGAATLNACRTKPLSFSYTRSSLPAAPISG